MDGPEPGTIAPPPSWAHRKVLALGRPPALDHGMAVGGEPDPKVRPARRARGVRRFGRGAGVRDHRGTARAGGARREDPSHEHGPAEDGRDSRTDASPCLDGAPPYVRREGMSPGPLRRDVPTRDPSGSPPRMRPDAGRHSGGSEPFVPAVGGSYRHRRSPTMGEDRLAPGRAPSRLQPPVREGTPVGLRGG